MVEFDNPDWNLSQVAAWIVYREQNLVENLANAGAHDFGAIGMFDSMWPDGRKKHGDLKDLQKALRDGKISATGYRDKDTLELKVVPKEAWADLHLRPPFAYQENQLASQHQPWQNIRVGSAAVKKHWRSPLEVDGRTLYSTALIHELRTEALNNNPNLGHNELITEIEALYQQRHPNKTVPSRSTIQRSFKKQA